MSTARITNTKHATNDAALPETPVTDDSRQLSRVTTPEMRSEYRSAQKSSGFFVLPEDITPLILTHSGKVVFELGLTCKYWNLEVRSFLTEAPQGRRILREKYEAAFRRIHRTSVVNAYRQLQSSSFQQFGNFKDAASKKECIEQLRTSIDPVWITSPAKGNWLCADLQSALATRSRKLNRASNQLAGRLKQFHVLDLQC